MIIKRVYPRLAPLLWVISLGEALNRRDFSFVLPENPGLEIPFSTF